MEPKKLAVATRHCDLVFHLASVVGKRLVSQDPHYAYEVSDKGTRNVLEATANVPIVLFSSSSVYGLTDNGASAETDDVHECETVQYDGGRQGYATGKLRVEELGARWSGSGRPVVIVRPFNIVGPGQSGSYGMVLPNMVRCALDGEPLTVYGDGSQVRSFSHISTFVRCLISLTSNAKAWNIGENVFNIGVSRATSINQLVALVLQETGSSSLVRKIPYDEIFPGEKDVLFRLPSVERLEGLIGRLPWPRTRAIVRDMISSIVAEKSVNFSPPHVMCKSDSEKAEGQV